jgi:hypothetical protein
MSTQDPFEARQREALAASDALLDRIGARAPTPEDLDDPIVAALALIAAEIDLDAVPVESTKARAALERVLPQLRSQSSANRRMQWHGIPAAGSKDDRHLVVELREVYRDAEHDDVAGTYRPAAAGGEWPGDEDPGRGPRRPGRRPEHAAVALAPPRSLPRFTPPPGRAGRSRTRPDGRPEYRLRPLTAVVAAVAAVVLGSGVSAVVTGGRSVNPVTGVQQVVAQLTNGRTADQQDLYDEDMQRIEAAQERLQEGDGPEAVRELGRITTAGLSSEDTDRVLVQVKQVLRRVGDR